jgi:hypothetical protein
MGVRLGVGGRGSDERLYVVDRCVLSQSSRWGMNRSPCSRLRGLRSGVPVLPPLPVPVDHMLDALGFTLRGLASRVSNPSSSRPLPLTLPRRPPNVKPWAKAGPEAERTGDAE